MTSLIIDTSTDQCLIAISRNGHIEGKEIFYHHNQLSELLMPKVETLVKEHCDSVKDFIEIAVGTGPGSYTGTRIGAAIAKTLAFGLQIPIKPFHSPLAFLPQQEGAFAFVLPTRSGKFYALTGQISSEQITMAPPFFFTAQDERLSAIDFLIFPPVDGLPDFLKLKRCFTPQPNLPFLNLFLSKTEPTIPENIPLHYFGTP